MISLHVFLYPAVCEESDIIVALLSKAEENIVDLRAAVKNDGGSVNKVAVAMVRGLARECDVNADVLDQRIRRFGTLSSLV